MESLRQDIYNLKMVDMHNHFDVDPTTSSILAKDFWDVGDYFWLRRHLWSAGYPVESESFSFEDRAKAYWTAFKRAENSVWARYLKKGLKSLYGVELKNIDSIYEIDAIIKQNYNKSGYTQEIADKIKLEKFIVNGSGDKDFAELSDKAVFASDIGMLYKWADKLLSGEDVRTEIFDMLKKAKASGRLGLRVSIPRMYEVTYTDTILKENMTRDEAIVAVLHFISEACEKYNMFIQAFMGVGHVYSDIPAPFNDGEGVAKLYGLFEKYNCTYTIITASQAQNIDVINAANIFSNVQADGLWWYNLRPSSYREVFETRMEELPSIRSSIVATDAYVIEWCYIKGLLIRDTLAEFMQSEIDKGHIDREMAIKVSEDWLCNSALELLGRSK